MAVDYTERVVEPLGFGLTFNEGRGSYGPDSLAWDSPVPYPSDGGMYEWNETEQSWVETTI